MDASFILHLTITYYKSVRGWSWGLGHLSWIMHSLRLDPKPDCTLTLSALFYALEYSKPTMLMTSQLRNLRELHRAKSDSGKMQANIRLMRV